MQKKLDLMAMFMVLVSTMMLLQLVIYWILNYLMKKNDIV